MLCHTPHNFFLYRSGIMDPRNTIQKDSGLIPTKSPEHILHSTVKGYTKRCLHLLEDNLHNCKVIQQSWKIIELYTYKTILKKRIVKSLFFHLLFWFGKIKIVNKSGYGGPRLKVRQQSVTGTLRVCIQVPLVFIYIPIIMDQYTNVISFVRQLKPACHQHTKVTLNA